MNIAVFQHVPFEGPGYLQHWADQKGHTIAKYRLYNDDPLPAMNEVDLLVVMGGPMGTYDEAEFPFLVKEKTYLKAYAEAGKKVIGICLGSQLLAEVLGGRVYKNNEKEIGWFEVEGTPDAASHPIMQGIATPFMAFHWHGDTFTLPEGAVHLLRTGVAENQAFLWKNNVLALQFHIETTKESFDDISLHCGDELQQEGDYIQDEQQMLEGLQHLDPMHRVLEQLLENWMILK